MVDTSRWAFLEQDTIVKVFDSLPRVWRNIYGLDELAAEELADLSWAGHEGEGFRRVVDSIPDYDPNVEMLQGPWVRIEPQSVHFEYIKTRIPFVAIPVADFGEDIAARSDKI